MSKDFEVGRIEQLSNGSEAWSSEALKKGTSSNQITTFDQLNARIAFLQGENEELRAEIVRLQTQVNEAREIIETVNYIYDVKMFPQLNTGIRAWLAANPR